MTILVSGATSQIGRFLLPRLARAGERVDAVSRHEQAAQPGVQWMRGDLATALPPHAPGRWRAIASFSPLQGWVDWLSRQQTAPAQKIIATSSMSALTKQHSMRADEQALAASLQRGEQGLIEQAERLGMNWVLLRPTLIYGAGIDHSLTPVARRAQRLRVFPIPLASGMRQPVHADDIAQAVLRAMQSAAADGRIIEIGGGERLRYDAMFRRVQASLKPRPLALPLPVWVLRALAALAPRMKGPVSRLEQPLLADNAPLQALLGIQPRPFQPDASTWRAMTPAQAQARIAAAQA